MSSTADWSFAVQFTVLESPVKLLYCHNNRLATGHAPPVPLMLYVSQLPAVQVSTVYLTLSQLQMARQVDTPHPHSQQPAEVVAGRLYHFTRQYINDVGLDTWIQEHGGMATLLDSEMVCARVHVCVCMWCCLYVHVESLW